MHPTWPVRFGKAKFANGRRHRPGDIGSGLPASALTYAYQSADVSRGLPALTVSCVHRSVIVRCGLPDYPWLAHIDHSTSGVANQYLPLPAHNGYPRQMWYARIAFGLHITVSRRRMWYSYFSYLLLIYY